MKNRRLIRIASVLAAGTAAISGLHAAVTDTSRSPAEGAVASRSPDLQIVTKLAQGSSAEIELGRIVKSKARNPAVKAFGQRMITDHSALLADATRWASERRITLDATPGQEEKKIIDRTARLSGDDFDRSYIEGMLDDHKKDVAEVARFIAAHPDSPATGLLKQALPTLEDHLRVAENVAGQIGVKPDAGLTRS